MDFNKYQNKLPYSKDPETRKAYREETNRLEALFFQDMADDIGYLGHPKQGILESIAWDMGHAYGYREVYNFAITLSELL